ncbi:putative non-specific serine/threonine protein kinase [Lupinus albus]|uniref:Putative non-specific serine/threonine protein kinase n=1 Tax=Lupinus albus TaxID=3870 RepID=A0A6A4QVT7_LUPAL|nr:putative non-specific serine/threonine protein kinase [Lupinus albus]
MSIPFLLLFLFLSFSPSQTTTPPKGFLIDCGALSGTEFQGRLWLPDSDFVSTGIPKNVTTPSVLLPTLQNVRSFSRMLNSKNCYKVPVYRGAKYMVRSTYFYGGVNGPNDPFPPVFDQIIDGTLWSVVNTTSDYANDSLYNTTDFTRFGLTLVARNTFGYSGPSIRYPDDQFDRIWEPFGKNISNFTKPITGNVSVSGFWNLPPLKLFETHLGSDQLESLELRWPTPSLPTSKYYTALYFADNAGLSRIFNISVNGITYYRNLNAIPSGVVVFANQWPLSGPTTITLTPSTTSSLGPLINAAEIFEVLSLGGRTSTRDVIALEKVKDSFRNPPLDWNGDPCVPRQYSWRGITCSDGPRIRVVTLNLTSMQISGSLSPFVDNMTALTNIWLRNNSLSGHIPHLNSLRKLKTLHLEDNQFSGEIPSSLGNISSLNEVFLQNNNLTGQIPANLIGKPKLKLRTHGNKLLSPSAP